MHKSYKYSKKIFFVLTFSLLFNILLFLFFWSFFSHEKVMTTYYKKKLNPHFLLVVYYSNIHTFFTFFSSTSPASMPSKSRGPTVPYLYLLSISSQLFSLSTFLFLSIPSLTTTPDCIVDTGRWWRVLFLFQIRTCPTAVRTHSYRSGAPYPHRPWEMGEAQDPNRFEFL